MNSVLRNTLWQTPRWVVSSLHLSGFINSSAQEKFPDTSPSLLIMRSGVPAGWARESKSEKKSSELKLEEKWPHFGSASHSVKRHDICVGSKEKLSLPNSAKASPSRLILGPYGCPGSPYPGPAPAMSEEKKEKEEWCTYTWALPTRPDMRGGIAGCLLLLMESSGVFKDLRPQRGDREREMACLEPLSSPRYQLGLCRAPQSRPFQLSPFRRALPAWDFCSLKFRLLCALLSFCLCTMLFSHYSFSCECPNLFYFF